MRFLLCCLFVLTGFFSWAQDNDYPDYRSKKENFVKMQEKDIRADLATFAFAGIDESVGKLPLKSIPVTNYGRDFIRYGGNNIQVIIQAGTFDAAKHKLFYNDKHLLKIDNKPYFGNYGELPKTTIASVTVIIDKDTIPIPPAALVDLYSPNFTYSDASGTLKSHNGVYLSPDNHKIYVYMLNREMKGSYEVTWVIKDKKYLRRVVDTGLLKNG